MFGLFNRKPKAIPGTSGVTELKSTSTPVPTPGATGLIWEEQRNGNVRIRLQTNNTEETRFALKQLKLKKKELALRKRNIVSAQQAIRAQHTDSVRRRGPAARGSSFIAKWSRSSDTKGRAKDRERLAKDLEPLERERKTIENWLLQVEKLILDVETELQNNP